MDSKNIEAALSTTNQKHSTKAFQIILTSFSIASFLTFLGLLILNEGGTFFLFLFLSALLSFLVGSFMAFGTNVTGIVVNTAKLTNAPEKRRAIILEISINFGILTGITLVAIIFIKHLNGVFAS
jgi:hypothetical protein